MNRDVAFSRSQFQHAWRVLCRASSTATIEEHDGFELIFSGLPVAFFNVAILTGDGLSREQLADCAHRACALALPTGLPWLLIVTHEALAEGVSATEVLDGCGLMPIIPLTGMRALRTEPLTKAPDGLLIEVARDDGACAAAFDINGAAYAADLAACKPTFGHRTFWDNHVLAVGRVDDAPVACAAVLMVDGHRYVAMVATLPGHQRRGYAEAVMRHGLDVATVKFGDRPTTLHATDAGRPIYERMGYETLAEHTAFIETRLLEGH